MSSPNFGVNEAYQDQVNMADVIVGTKADLLGGSPTTAPAATRAAAHEHLAGDGDAALPAVSSFPAPLNSTGGDRGDEARCSTAEVAVAGCREGEQRLSEFWSWASELYPPKAQAGSRFPVGMASGLA